MFNDIPIIANPWEHFRNLRLAARENSDPLADLGFFATVDPTGQPQNRTLVLRTDHPDGVDIYFNKNSPKWFQLTQIPRFELLVYWASQKSQFRIQGSWKEVPLSTLEKGWQKQQPESKLLDHFYQECQPQSTTTLPIDFLNQMETLDKNLPRPISYTPSAIGITLVPLYIEWLYLVSQDRCHYRCKFTKSSSTANTWIPQFLVP